MKKTLVTLLATVFAVAAFAGPAAATHTRTHQDGLVNVVITDITVIDGDVEVLKNVDIGVAAQIAANVCGFKVGPVAVLGQAVDRSGATRTVCETDTQRIELTQN